MTEPEWFIIILGITILLSVWAMWDIIKQTKEENDERRVN